MSTAIIAGASGLVGRNLLELLLTAPEYDRVISLGRNYPDRIHPKLEHRVVDFAALEEVSAFPPCDDAFCCLGTTMRQAGSRETFRAVDHTAVLAFAWSAQRRGAQRFFLVSALGADPTSRIFYRRVKGETEEALGVLGFKALRIFRPSMLLGVRPRVRPGERLLGGLLWLVEPLLWGRFRKYRAIQAEVVARAMLRSSYGRDGPDVLVYLSDEIQDLGAYGAAET